MYLNLHNLFSKETQLQNAVADALTKIKDKTMPRFAQFIIMLEGDEEKSIKELQNDFDDAVKNEDYIQASKLKEEIAKRIIAGVDETDMINEYEETCIIDLDEVAAFYQSFYIDTNEQFTKVILKGGYEIPLQIKLEDFKKVLFS